MGRQYQYDSFVLSLQRPASSSRCYSASRLLESSEAVLSLPLHYLRAADDTNCDPITHQRIDVEVDPDNGKPLMGKQDSPFSLAALSIERVNLNNVDDEYEVVWSDGHCSRYSVQFVNKMSEVWKETHTEDRILWSGLTEEFVRESDALSISFVDSLTESGMSHSLWALFKYGILLVKNTPTSDNGTGVAALAASLSGGKNKVSTTASILKNYQDGDGSIVMPHATEGPMRSLYGTVWSTHFDGQPDGSSVADSAYSQSSLPLHTDMTYYRDPPGLQIFTMVQPSIEGGESVFCDGFAIAEQCRFIDPSAFQTLSTTVRRYRCIDSHTGWHLEASGPVIDVQRGRVVGIRHNDLDRLPDLPPTDVSKERDIKAFYDKLSHAHSVWDKLLGDDEYRLVMKLNPGDTVVVANQVSFSKPSFSCSPIPWYLRVIH